MVGLPCSPSSKHGNRCFHRQKRRKHARARSDGTDETAKASGGSEDGTTSVDADSSTLSLRIPQRAQAMEHQRTQASVHHIMAIAIVINRLFRVHSCLGMSWHWTRSPLMVPWWAQLQVHVVILHSNFSIVLYQHMPLLPTPANSLTHAPELLVYFSISKQPLYGRFSQVSPAFSPQQRIRTQAFNDYSPSSSSQPTTWTMTYLIAFALSTCVIVYVLL